MKEITIEDVLKKHWDEKYGSPSYEVSHLKRNYEDVVIAAMIEYASLNRQGWTRADMPKDGTVIQRWHKYWNCPISVKCLPNKFAHEWVEATLAHSWPEESFSEDWMPLPNKPEPI